MKRNFITGIMACALAAMTFSSCGKGDEVISYEDPTQEEVPTDAVDLLAKYPNGPLKKVINRDKHPFFLLACGVEDGDFTNPNSKYYTIVPENYDEISAGNAMKYASCVGGTGSLNFSHVQRFIARAKEQGIKVYGHTLAWHSQQQVNYLKNLVDKQSSAEGKKQALEKELDRWIGGMMKACGGYVTSWDAVNEPLSGGGNYNNKGICTLQDYDNSAQHNYNAEKDNFFWQHFLGPEDYVPTVVNLARKHFEANGGDPASLKLFVNDYNLESFWDENYKAKSMVGWVKLWESKGCKIDGIGTQMHISCYENEEFEKNSRQHITEMFKILAGSGKLIRISELDMGYNNSTKSMFDAGLMYNQLSDKQKQRMADKYEWLYKEYFRVVPKKQQYGICQWAITDAPDTPHMWRRGEPLGLWTTDFQKKPAFYGTLRGLAEGTKN